MCLSRKNCQKTKLTRKYLENLCWMFFTTLLNRSVTEIAFGLYTAGLRLLFNCAFLRYDASEKELRNVFKNLSTLVHFGQYSKSSHNLQYVWIIVLNTSLTLHLSGHGRIRGTGSYPILHHFRIYIAWPQHIS